MRLWHRAITTWKKMGGHGLTLPFLSYLYSLEREIPYDSKACDAVVDDVNTDPDHGVDGIRCNDVGFAVFDHIVGDGEQSGGLTFSAAKSFQSPKNQIRAAKAKIKEGVFSVNHKREWSNELGEREIKLLKELGLYENHAERMK